MAIDQTTEPNRPGILLGWIVRIAAVAALIALAMYLAVLWAARPAIERAASMALGTPVTIGSLSWSPLSGRITAGSIAIGGRADQITLDHLSVVAQQSTLPSRTIVLLSVELNGPRLTVRLDEHYRPLLEGILADAVGGEADEPPRPLRVAVRELDITDGALTIRYPVRDKHRDATLDISRLTAADIDVTSTAAGLALQAEGTLEGAIDGAPLQGEARLRVDGAEREITAELTMSNAAVNRDILTLPPQFESFSGIVDADATLAIASAPPRRELDLDLTVRDARLSGRHGTAATAKRIALPKLHIDLLRNLVGVGPAEIQRPTLTLPIDQLRDLAPAPREGDEPSPWTVTAGDLTISEGEIRLRRADATATLRLSSLRSVQRRGGDRSLVATLAAGDGGSIALDGTLRLTPLAADVEARLDGLALPALSAVVPALPLRLSKGRATGTVRGRYREGLQQLSGRLHLEDVHTVPPAAERPTEVMAVHQADVEFALDPSAAPPLRIATVELSYPYVLVQRHRGGTFPASLFAAEPSAEPPPALAAGAPADASPRLRIGRLTVEGGKLEFVDATLEPPYWSSLAGIDAEASGIVYPGGTVERFSMSAKLDELSPVEIAGSVTPTGLQGRAQIDDLLLASLNAYVAPALGYRFTSGRLSTRTSTTSALPLLESTADIVLRGVGVEQTGLDLIQQQSGVPLPIALALIANHAGEIRLKLPFALDVSARSVTVGSTVWQAVRKAIVGALTSPLRLLGSLFGKDQAPHAFAVDPIPFASGSGVLDAAGKRRIADIAQILQAHPDLVLVLMPQITDWDITEVGRHRAEALAKQRSDEVREAFAGEKADPRLDADRLMIVPWEPAAGAQATKSPGVYAELQDKP